MVPSKLRDALRVERGSRTLPAQNGELRAQKGQLRRRNQPLHCRLGDLKGRLAGLHRVENRQAAPFSKGEPKPPRGLGGVAYAMADRRMSSPPERVDRSIAVDVPTTCGAGGGALEPAGTAEQFREEAPGVVAASWAGIRSRPR